ncbi:hypothetical protein FQN54_005200 [Arachnomyces sp. PD_36]|nr:hypothetical protein FQN54_005200 [Arachnomyces sp. PD_36]
MKEAAQLSGSSSQLLRSESEGRCSTDDGSHSHTPFRYNVAAFCSTDAAFVDIEDATLGPLCFTETDIKALFKVFSSNFYHHLPILDPDLTISSMQRSSPLLFWTIVIITVRHHSGYSHCLPDLTEPYMNLLRGIITNSPMTLPTMQALLFSCTWPLPVKSQPMDPSWNYCGLCINAALYMGLHRPNTEQSLRVVGVSSGNRKTRIMTWLACFLVGTSLSSYHGLPAPLRSASDLETIETLIRDPIVPPQMAAHIDIYRCIVKYFTILSDSSDSIIISSLKDLFEKEIDETRNRFPGSWDTRTEVNLLTVKLYFYSAMTVKQTKQTVRPEDSIQINNPARFSYRTTLSYGLSTSVRLIQLICNDLIAPDKAPSETGSDTSQSVTILFNGLPKNYLRTLAFSAFFLIKYFALDPACNPDEQNIARNHVIMAYSQFTRFSTDPLDESSRVATVIEALSRSQPSSSRGPYALRTSDRLGASILYDVVSTASEIRNLPVHVAREKELPQSSSSGSNYESQQTFDNEADMPTADTWVWNTDLPQNIWNELDLGTLIAPEEIYPDFSESQGFS